MLSFLPFKEKPRRFDYKPLYFDPEKEAREERKKQVLGESYTRMNDDGTPKEYIPGEFIRELKIRRGVIATQERGSKIRSSSVRMLVFVVLAGLFLILIFPMISGWLETFFSAFSS